MSRRIGGCAYYFWSGVGAPCSMVREAWLFLNKDCRAYTPQHFVKQPKNIYKQQEQNTYIQKKENKSAKSLNPLWPAVDILGLHPMIMHGDLMKKVPLPWPEGRHDILKRGVILTHRHHLWRGGRLQVGPPDYFLGPPRRWKLKKPRKPMASAERPTEPARSTAWLGCLLHQECDNPYFRVIN